MIQVTRCERALARCNSPTCEWAWRRHTRAAQRGFADGATVEIKVSLQREIDAPAVLGPSRALALALEFFRVSYLAHSPVNVSRFTLCLSSAAVLLLMQCQASP